MPEPMPELALAGPRVSIVMPAYNEEEGIVHILGQLKEAG